MATDPVPASSTEDVTQLRDRVNDLIAASERLTQELARQRATEAALGAAQRWPRRHVLVLHSTRDSRSRLASTLIKTN
jgi:hypothetical protein